MYIYPDFVEMGLKEGQEFPTETHKTVAVAIAIGNPNVTTKEMLETIVQIIIKIPDDRIEIVSYDQLVNEFKMPNVGMYK